MLLKCEMDFYNWYDVSLIEPTLDIGSRMLTIYVAQAKWNICELVIFMFFFCETFVYGYL